jgi:hypothetical protein
MRILLPVFSVAVVLLGNCWNSYGQSKFEIGPLQSCTAADNARWNLLETEFNAVQAQDPDTPTVAQYSVGRFGYYGIYLFPYNWLPLSDTKQTMCGRFARFDWNQVFTNENDWNIRLIPSKYFYNAFDDAVPYASDPSQVWSCDPVPNEDPARHSCGVSAGPEYGQIKHNCFEAEATPRNDRFQTPWFKKNDLNNACSNIVDYSLCVYGPYVTESVHGNRPEIHPTQALWWRNKQGLDWESTEAQSWTLLHVQDASERFQEVSDFAPRPSDDLVDWAPWAAPKQPVLFDISLETDATPSTPVTFKVNEFIGDGIVPIEAGNAPRQVLVTFQGKPLYTISQIQNDTNRYEINRVSGVCTTSNGGVRSTVRIRSTIGSTIRGGKGVDLGFQAIQFWNGNAADPTPSSGEHGLFAFTPGGPGPSQIDPNTVNARFEDGKLRVTARVAPSRTRFFQQEMRESEEQQVDIQSLLGPDTKVALRTKILQIHTSRATSSSATALLAGFLGVNSNTPSFAERVSDLVFAAAPQLTIVRSGIPAWEDSEELFSAFNQRLASAGRNRLKQLLNSSADMTNWSLKAWQCGEHPDKGCATKGPEVKIVYVKPPPGAPLVYVQADFDGDIPRFHVEFPTTGTLVDTLIWLRATGPTPSDGSAPQILDFFNVTVPVSGDSDSDTERIVNALATFVGVPPSKLAGGPVGSSPDPFIDSQRFRIAQMLRMQIKHAADGFDQEIEPQAMALFLNQARRLAALP